MSREGELKKRFDEMLNASYWNPEHEKLLKESDVKRLFEELAKEYQKFEKEIEHLLAQNIPEERKVVLRYVLNTLRDLNEKWFGFPEAPK